MTLGYIYDRLRAHYLPTDFHRMVHRWNKDNPCDLLRYDYPLNKQSIALDLGGFKGEWAANLYARFACRVYVFEPVKHFAGCMKARYAPNPDLQVLDFGLGGATRMEAINVSGDGSSVFQKKVGDTEQIRIVDVVEWLDGAGIHSVDLMKINIEGGEYELLERMIQAGIVDRVKHILVQFHDFFPDAAARMEAIQSHLRKTHAPMFQYRFVWESWTRKN